MTETRRFKLLARDAENFSFDLQKQIADMKAKDRCDRL
jgi:hypothetical protein